MAKLRLEATDVEAALHAVIGTASLLRAREQIDQGEVVKLRWRPELGEALGQVQGHASGFAVATVTTDAHGAIAGFEGACTCGGHPNCSHPAALALLALTKAPRADVPRSSSMPKRRAAKPAAWEMALAKLSGEAAAIPRQAGSTEPAVALQFDLVEAQGRAGKARPWRVAMRPVVPGRTGWIRGGISWSSLGYAHIGQGAQGEQHRRLLNEILLLSRSGERQYYGYHQQPMVFLDEFPSRRIWDLLAEAEEIGLPLVLTGKASAKVTVARMPARVSLEANRTGDGLELVPALMVDGVAVAPQCSVLLGQPIHGVAWWAVHNGPAPAAKDRVLRLAPLAGPLQPGIESALTGPPILIPARDEERFFQEHYPKLLRRFQVVASGEEVKLPDAGPATLTLTVDPLPQHQLGLGWRWVQSVGGEQHDEPLYAPSPVGMAMQRDNLVHTVAAVVAIHVPGLLEPSPGGTRLAEAATVAGDDMIHLLNGVIPALIELEGVDVDIRPGATSLEYREVHEAPAISFGSNDAVAESDWFDLAVRVTVGGEAVAFEELFVALAQDRQYLILPSGTYFTLDRDEFRQLRELIAESRAMTDSPEGVLRVSRFQAGLWQELAELGEITGQARAWQDSVRALTEFDDTVERSVPQSVCAVLRPYQHDGFAWLATLYDHGLGGILADDMGLGKTLQALALICRARDSGSHAPFLVVAPASVVHNWVGEAERFTPDLTVRAITQTRARRLGGELADAVAGADVVVTSYTLFRLEHDDYQALKWGGLILDEAQFIKNHQSQGYRCARLLTAPFKLAITGTPMENNLAELWSLCSVTAPGLFPRLDRFTEYYRNPIEKGHDVERLAQLRRRIKPLMLRRRKAEVAADLPDKQEQVVELELDRRHRKVYQTYLQRERQKVLGLLGDLERNRFEIFRSLTLLRQASLDVSLIDPKHHNIPSTKLDALTEQITDLVAEGHRTLVFSQFTRFLESARTRLERAGIQCCYLDGKTRNRKDVLAEFKNGTASVFLISLKAGGFGLNLTEADYCILLDPWWNPATEAQAVDRVHRIGQTRNVMVYRMVAKDTIEEKVMALKARKAELFSSVLDGGEFASARLTASDIRALLE